MPRQGHAGEHARREEGYAGDGGRIWFRRFSLADPSAWSRRGLLRYDGEHSGALAYFNKRRKEPLVLRYFQHLALLVTAAVSRPLFNHEKALRAALTSLFASATASAARWICTTPSLVSEDLTKLAFWMATRSGKTILMHFHYRQFLHYNTKPWITSCW